MTHGNSRSENDKLADKAMDFFKKLISSGKGSQSSKARQYTQQELEAVWEGTPYIGSMAFAQMISPGKDKTQLSAAASEYFDMACYARSQGNTEGMILALCTAIAFNVIAANYLDAAAALGNLAMAYEQNSQFATALRLQRYALQLKIDYGGAPDVVARSYWLIGRAEAALGNYEGAALSLRTSLSVFLNPRVVLQLAWINERIKAGDRDGKLPPDLSNDRKLVSEMKALAVQTEAVRTVPEGEHVGPAEGPASVAAPTPAPTKLRDPIGNLEDVRRHAKDKLKELNYLSGQILGLKTMREEATHFYPKLLRETRTGGGNYAKVLYDYGTQLSLNGKMRSAERALRLAVEHSRTQSNSDPIIAYVDYYLAVAIETLAPDKLHDLEQYLVRYAEGTRNIFRSRIAERLNHKAEAIKLLTDAVRMLEQDGPNASWYTALMDLAELYEDSGDADEAIKTAKAALVVAEQALETAPFRERDSLRSSISRAVEYLIPLLVSSQHIGEWDAIDIVERARGRSLLESIGEEWMPIPGNLPEEARRKEVEFLSYLRYEKRLRHVSPVERDGLKSLGEEEYRRRLWQHLDTLPRDFTPYVQLRKGLSCPVADCIKFLQPGHPRTHTFIFYSYSGGLVRWWIDDSAELRDCTVVPILATELQSKVSEFLQYCATPTSSFKSRASDLCEILFGSILDTLPEDANLLIIPSGPLFNVPFCALLRADQFLIERFPICTLPCLSLVRYWRMGRVGPGRLVVGNSQSDLPSAAAEAIAVARLLNAAPLLADEVERHTIEKQVAVCCFIHIACHAIINDSVPGFSGFILADQTLLSAQDLSEARLRCRLAFLSACKTGWVTPRFEDDPLSIGASLLHAGAQLVIFTLWDISDFVTKDLAVQFYEELLGGYSPNRCLRNAQISVLKRARYSHPFYWAAFQLTGDWAPCVTHKGKMIFG